MTDTNEEKIDSQQEKDFICSKTLEDDQGVDIYKLYLDEVNRYSLLTNEEVAECYKYLGAVKTLKILENNDIHNIQNIDLATIFKSCCNNKNYEVVIKTLLEYYKNVKNEYGKRYYDQLKKYMDLAMENGKALTETELSEYFDFNFSSAKVVSEKELLADIKLYFKCRESYEKMFNSNLRLVTSIAQKYNPNRYDILELINEGNIGLMRAIEKFDISLGYKFSTYAIFWIKQAISRSSQMQNQSIKLPVLISNKTLKYKRQIEELEKKYGPNLPLKLIQKELGYSYKEICMYEQCLLGTVSLDQIINEDCDITIEDFIESNIEVDADAEKKLLNTELNALMVALDSQEKTVIIKRYGINGDNEMTQEQVGNQLNLTKARIGQIEIKALMKMRKFSKVKGYELESYLK